MATSTFGFKALLAGAVMACALLQPAAAAEISGVKFDDTVKLAGTELKLNGVGLRTRFIVKVYAAGLYLPEKKSTVADIMRLEGPRRLTLVMLRDISSDDFSQSFMTGLNNNIDKAEKSRYLTHISKFGEMFGAISGLKKGDVLHIDWIPGTGTQCELNGKKIGEALPDVNYYNAVLKIWLGDKPADNALKPALLGEAR